MHSVLRLHEVFEHPVGHFGAHFLTRFVLEPEVNTAIDSAVRLILRHLREACVISRHIRIAGAAQPLRGEGDLIRAMDQPQCTRRACTHAGLITGMRRIGRRSEQRFPRRICSGQIIHVFIGALYRRDWPPESVDELAGVRGLQSVMNRYVQERICSSRLDER